MRCHPADHRPDPETVDGMTAVCVECDARLKAMGFCERCDGRGCDVHHEPCLWCFMTGLEGWSESP